MTEFLGNMYSCFTFIPKITLSNLFEILILTVLIYEVLLWVKSTRAGVLLRGGMIIVGFYLLAAMLHLNTITWIINHMGQLVLTALIIIFQPELRKALEQLGSKNIITDLFISENSRQQEGYTEKTVNEITPLHDGAIIIRGNRVTSATCYLPLSDNLSISKDLGTRHRAALGISESTDSLTVVVSEETGRVSLAEGGSLRRINSPEELKLAIAAKPEEETVSGPFKLLKGWHKNERKAE